MEKKEERIEKIDPILFAVLAAKIDAIVRMMTLSITYTARSSILNSCHDFSVSILTGGRGDEIRLISMYGGVPVHCATTMKSVQPFAELYWGDIREGDMFFTNDPYSGNTHHADYTMVTPVFSECELMFWIIIRCHQNDTGMYIPDTYGPYNKDIYMEGPIIPPIRIQRDYKDIPEWVRFFRANIRYPDVYFGDYLAQVGGIRTGEKALKEFCKRYGNDTIKLFIEGWLDYTESMLKVEIRKLPKGTWYAETRSDPLEFAPEGILLNATLTIDPDQGKIIVDLTKNPDNVQGGVNTSEAMAQASVAIGLMPAVAPKAPLNAGFWRCFEVKLRKGCVAGIPKFPASTSTATTYVPERLIDVMTRIMCQVDPTRGASDGSSCCGGMGVISGKDYRKNYEPYGHGMFIIGGGGPATMNTDGWSFWFSNVTMGAILRESIELHEMRVPHIIKEVGLMTDSAGAGQWRGGIGEYFRLHPIKTRISIAPLGDGEVFPKQGVLGGKAAMPSQHFILDAKTGEKKQHIPQASPILYYCEEDEDWFAVAGGGGGFGDPLERDPKRVSWDARNELISLEAARNDYGVVLKTETELYDVDYEATEKLRKELKAKKKEGD